MDINHMGQPFLLNIKPAKHNRDVMTVVVHHIAQVKTMEPTTERRRVVEEVPVFEADGKGILKLDDQNQPVQKKDESGKLIFNRSSKMEDVTVEVETWTPKPKEIGKFVIFARVPKAWIKKMAKNWITENADEKIFATDGNK